ncbi:semaphorin-7A isoform X2 [Scophthalmus maximus]|uniref:semaphorin-7A isoform X2 n=1 Tax=Scophthalmus maximus TaxID=52904 RepID=UPI0015E0A7C5|nr:semaphorin-7A isoform X2 [Scophthalmus maximus]
MRRLVVIYIWLVWDVQRVLGVGWTDGPTPRLLSNGTVSVVFEYEEYQKHLVFFQHENSTEMYVGGTDFVLRLDTDDYHIKEILTLKTTGNQLCEKGPCENVITVIEKFYDGLFVCGTNGHKPQCWKLLPSVNNQSHEIVESYEGTGISPLMYTQNSLSLTVDGDLYAAAPMDSDRRSLQFRRRAGRRNNVWMYENWLSEPTLISVSWVKQNEDPDNEKIYLFFRENNSDHRPDADPWISKVARVCKVDKGGSKRFFQNMWTSFLKARLVCGFPEESLYFNHLQDIYVTPDDDWQKTRVYALFSSSWNFTAVCIYSVGMIEKIFESSTFKGYSENIPNPRPGKCVKDSMNLPRTTITVVKDNPEMTDWVHSVHYTAPFYTSSIKYTRIAVDQVQAVDHVYNVLLLATDSGKIHKILEAGSEAFIISETQLSYNSTLQSMKLDSKQKKLVVGFSEKISIMDLRTCQDYNNSCADCVLARDPYCAWTEVGCTPTVPGGIQNVLDGQITVCSLSAEEMQVNQTKQETDSSTPVHSVPLGVPFYLSCPIDSYHAVYTWEHRNLSSPCLQMQSNCLHLIPAMAQENYGIYECVSREKDYTKVVKQYQLSQQTIAKTKMESNTPSSINYASAAVSQTLLVILGLSVAFSNL